MLIFVSGEEETESATVDYTWLLFSSQDAEVGCERDIGHDTNLSRRSDSNRYLDATVPLISYVEAEVLNAGLETKKGWAVTESIYISAGRTCLTLELSSLGGSQDWSSRRDD